MNNADIDNAEDLDIVIPTYYLQEYSNNYDKTSTSLWQYCRYEPDNNIRNSGSSKFKSMLINNTGNDCAVNVAILVPLKYLGNNWKTFEKPLINCEITLDIIWSENCVIFKQGRETTFLMTDAKLYVSVVTIITQDNVKLLQRLKSGFKRTISWNKYLSKIKTFAQN